MADLGDELVAQRDRLLRLTRRRLGAADDAEDCVQEALTRCLAFDDLDPDRVGPFLTAVTVRLCVDRARRRATEERLVERLARRRGDARGPEDTACDRDAARRLARAWATLPPRQREVMQARLDGLSCAEIARRFRTTTSAVESSLARTRASLRRVGA